jgi:hypothetical protein
MAKKTSKTRIEQYEHADKERTNNPQVGLVTKISDPDTGEKKPTSMIRILIRSCSGPARPNTPVLKCRR